MPKGLFPITIDIGLAELYKQTNSRMERGAQGLTNGGFTGSIHLVHPEQWPEHFRESYLILLFKELFFTDRHTQTDKK
jgi:hypothetical protein